MAEKQSNVNYLREMQIRTVLRFCLMTVQMAKTIKQMTSHGNKDGNKGNIHPLMVGV